MFRKLDRYVLKELAVPTVSSTLIVAGLFAGNELIHVYQTFNVNTMPVMTMLKLVLLSLPHWMTLTFPVGVAMGCSLAMSRLTREGELTAIRASGVSIRRTMFMIWVTGLAFAGLTFYFGENVAPQSRREHMKLAMEASVVSGFPDLQSNFALRLGAYNVSLREVRRIDDDRYALSGVLAVRWVKPGEVMVFKSETGAYDRGVWSFPNGTMWQFVDDSLVNFSGSESLVLNEKISLPDLIPSLGMENRTREELWGQVETLRAAGGNALGAEVKFYERFAIPAACLIFALASSFISIRFSKASAFQGLMLSLLMALGYYNLHMVCISIIGPNGWLPPMVAVWLPVGLFGVAALIMGARLE